MSSTNRSDRFLPYKQQKNKKQLMAIVAGLKLNKNIYMYISNDLTNFITSSLWSRGIQIWSQAKQGTPI